jgi:DNA-binding response OmpR family regulator
VPGTNGESHRERPLVLIVDTNAATVDEMAATVRTEDYAVLTALTFERGKALWCSQHPDVLVVDIRLGQYNGLQLLIRARGDRPDLTAVVTSPVPDPVLEAESLRCGATYLIKPVSGAQLVNAIQKSMADRSRGQPDTAAWWQTLSDRRSPTDRRQRAIPGYEPDRRIAQRRIH